MATCTLSPTNKRGASLSPRTSSLTSCALISVVGDAAGPFEWQLHSALETETEPLEVVLEGGLPLQRGIDRSVVLVHHPELLAEPVEERVAADRQRICDRDRTVRRGPLRANVGCVLELAPHAACADVVRNRLELVDAGVDIRVVGPDDAAVHRGPGDERLDGGTQVVAALHGAVDEHRLVGVGPAGRRIDLLAEQLLELVAADVPHPPVVEPRVAGHRQDLTVGVVLHHDRAGRCLVLDPLLMAELLRARIDALDALGFLRVDRVVCSDVLTEDVGRQMATLQQLGLERLLGVLLDVEIDRQLDVLAGNRIDMLVDQLANDASGRIDLEDLFAPRAVQRALHRQLDAERADELVGVVATVLVVLLGLLRDRPEISDDVACQGRIRVDPLPLLDDLDAREILAALLEVRDRVFVDAFLQRQRQQRAVALALRALRNGGLAEAWFVAALQIDDGHLQGTRQALEQGGADLRPLDDAPVDGHREDPLVVGKDPHLGVEDAATLGWDQHLTQLCGGHLRLERGRFHALQEPQARPEQADHQHRHQRQHSQARRAIIDRHGTIVLCRGGWRGRTHLIRGSPARCGAWHQRTIGRAGRRAGSAGWTPAVTIGTISNIRLVSHPSWPVRNLTTGIAASPTADPIATKIAASHHWGSGVMLRTYPDVSPARP